MYIKSLKIRNFRNIEKIDIDLDKNINIFVGNNAQGKTSILESIYVLALSKSSKNLDELELIRKNSSFSRIEGNIKSSRTSRTLEVILEKNKKRLKVDKNEIKKVSSYISNLNVIMFSPDDLDIIKKSPSFRRNLINTTLCQLFPNYLRILNEYNKLLKIRNDYLKSSYQNIDEVYLEIVTDKLIERAIVIMQYRSKFIDNINNYIADIYSKITTDIGLRVIYENSLKSYDKENLKKFFKENLFNDINKKVTLYGPHRDDISFILDDMDLKLYGSQGQQRVAILAFKLSEINLFKLTLGYYPVVLLDDIFSELDVQKRNNLLKFIKSNMQFVISTTDILNISNKIVNKAKVFKIKNGKIC